MLLSKFYNLLDAELTALLELHSADERTKTHKEFQNNKGYALLIWFLKFYGQKDLYRTFVTDGKDDNSCDIVFSNKNVMEETIFYVIQSKYVAFDATKKREEAFPQLSKQEFGYAISDFTVILNGTRKVGTNENFNRKYNELKLHLEKNGKVKFIFFTLANSNEEIEGTFNAFNKNNAPNITLEIIDIQKIRRDYIEFRYKEIYTSNPLEYHYNPEDTIIDLPIERFKSAKRDVFEFEGREKAAIVLLKPKTVYDLFKKYKFSLFFKNVRNPIHRSNYNPKIINTLLEKPNAFWYFNNGLTAITKILPDIGNHAKEIQVAGLQIINGAQTVYSVYQAYEQAKPIQRKAMDTHARLMLRLIGSSDNEFNLQITRFTNSQNPLEDRDFWANDPVQQRLQDASFTTNIWYEKRRGEFRLEEGFLKKMNIRIFPNEYFALSYLTFYLQKPIYAVNIAAFFTSRRDDKDGLYESIFNDATQFEDMYASTFMMHLSFACFASADDAETMHPKEPLLVFAIALSNILLHKYYAISMNTGGKSINLSRHLIQIHKNKQQNKQAIAEIIRILKHATFIMNSKITTTADLDKIVKNPIFYEIIRTEVEESTIDIEKIKAIELNEKELKGIADTTM